MDAIDEWGIPLDEEVRRFYRLIDDRKAAAEDGTQDVTLACGHVITFVNPIEDSQMYAHCSQCSGAWLNKVFTKSDG